LQIEKRMIFLLYFTFAKSKNIKCFTNIHKTTGNLKLLVAIITINLPPITVPMTGNIYYFL